MIRPGRAVYSSKMPSFIYRCPNTRDRIQGFVAEDVPRGTFEAVICTLCRQLHFVEPATGRVLGEDFSSSDE
jgi:hypothetical protein